jgi:glycosyltransferase involved in cell wall biosynthesis
VRICFVSLSSIRYYAEVPGAHGGAEAQTKVLAEELAAQGHQVSVVLSGWDPALPRRSDLRLLNAYHPSDGIAGLRFLPRWRGLDRALEAADADVYFQMCAAAATGQTAWFCRRARRGFVFATASNTDVDPRAVRLGRRDRMLYRYGLKRADRIITQHQEQADRLKSGYGANSVPVALAAAPLGEPTDFEGPPSVLWLGSFRTLKRPDLCLDLAARFPDTRFVMVGGRFAREPEVFDKAETRARGMDNVDFLGSVTDIEPHIRNSWVLLNTSEVEGFPTTFLEAWSVGIPTVSFFDPAGIVAGNGLGWIADDLPGLERSLRHALTDAGERRSRGSAGWAYVEREHLPAAVANKVLALFESVVQGAPDEAR